MIFPVGAPPSANTDRPSELWLRSTTYDIGGRGFKGLGLIVRSGMKAPQSLGPSVCDKARGRIRQEAHLGVIWQCIPQTGTVYVE